MGDGEKEQRFAALYAVYIDEIYRYVYLRTGLHQATAEDLTQEIFLDAFKGLERFKGLCSERTWIYRIAKHKVADFFRDRYRTDGETEDISAECAEQLRDPAPSIEILMETAVEQQQILDCLKQLPEHYQLVLLLKYVDTKSIKEIAMLTEKSAKAVESTLQRAKTAFIRQYQKTTEGEVQR